MVHMKRSDEGVARKSWMESSWDIPTQIRSLGTCSLFPSKSWREKGVWGIADQGSSFCGFQLVI